MTGLQDWHLVILANLFILAVVIFLLYGYFSRARKRRGRKREPPHKHYGELDE